jgi:prevent-host-death family protein
MLGLPLCYNVLHHEDHRVKSQQVGVRELRQNLSQYLHRVTAGERFEVTEHNLPVAILAPLPGRNSALERLTAAGHIVPARLDLAKLGPPPERPCEMTISEALAEQRRDD